MDMMANRTMLIKRIARYIILFSVICMFGLHGVAIVYDAYLNLDVAYFLSAGQMLLKGARPYVEIVDPNLPMIIYFSAIPAAISDLTHLPLTIVGSLFMYFLVIFTMLLFGKMLKIIIPQITHYHIEAVYVVWLASSLWIYKHGDFGQREQLIILTLAPFILLRYARYIQVHPPRYLVIVIAVLSFCMIAIKPFYLLPILLIEIIYLWTYCYFPRPVIALELLLWSCFGIAYLGHFYLIPGMSAFYDYWLGVITRGYPTYYSVGRMALLQILWERPFLPLLNIYLLVAIGLCGLVFCRKSSLRLLAGSYGWFACVTFILYIWQAKGWPYQLIPFFYGIFIGLTLLFIDIYRHVCSNFRGATPLLSMLTLIIVVISSLSLNKRVSAPSQASPFQFPRNAFVEVIELLTTPEESVLFLSPIVAPAFPNLTYTGRLPGGRFLCTYPLVFFFRDSADYVPPPQWRADEAKFYEILKEDIDTVQPKLILIDTRDHLPGIAPYFTIPEYLRRKGFYAMISSSYQHVGEVERFEIYLLTK